MKYKEIDHEEYKYQTTEDYRHKLSFNPQTKIEGAFYTLNESGDLLIKKGYAWDGASGGMIDTESTMRAALVHDVLYQMIRSCELDLMWKEPSDNEFRLIQIEDAQWWNRWWITARAQYAYHALQIAGESSCVPGSQTKNEMRYDS